MGPSGDSHTAVQSLEFARANDLTAAVGRAYINLVSGHLERLAYVKAGQFLDEGLSYCSERDMLIHHTWLLAHRSTWHLEQGRWLEAEEDAEQALTSGETVSFTALLTRGLLQSRRGSPMAESTLDEVRLFAERTGDNQVLIPAGMAMLEWAWLNGQLASKANLAAELRELARNIDNHRFDLSAIWFWLHRAGAVDETPPDLFEPHVQQIVGDWRAAATSWREIGRPYAEADALAGASEPDSLMAALEILDGLGARPLAAMVRAKLTELGVTHVPRGPRRSTRSSPAGLTTRQTEVLGLLAHGLTYHEIANQLFLSVKTVDHHAAAVRAKLGVTTRDEAVALARRKGILQASEA
jgi:DNA-binding CsgD family transcriptional regulator